MQVYCALKPKWFTNTGIESMPPGPWAPQGQNARAWALRAMCWLEASTTIYKCGNLDNLLHLSVSPFFSTAKW